MRIAYISDIHLEFLASNAAKKHAREFSVDDMSEMFCAGLRKIKHDFAVVAGDISHCPADVVRFFAKVDEDAPRTIYVTLGNHDFWNWQSSLTPNKFEQLPDKNVPAIEEWFKEKFKAFKNVKLLVAGDKFTHGDFTIIGDCGFAAYNHRFNCRAGIYRGAILCWQDEVDLSERWRKFYLNEIADDKKMLIITHTPPTDWGGDYTDENQNKRFYIFGHVHDIDSRATGVEIVKTVNYYGDAANGYKQDHFEFKILQID